MKTKLMKTGQQRQRANLRAPDEEAIIAAAMAILRKRNPGASDPLTQAAALIADDPLDKKERKMLFVSKRMQATVEKLSAFAKGAMAKRIDDPARLSVRPFNFSGMLEMVVEYADADRAAFERWLGKRQPELVKQVRGDRGSR